MNTYSRDIAVEMAESNKCLAPIFQEIHDSGKFLLSDGTTFWGSSRHDLPDDQLVGAYEVWARSKGSEILHVITIQGRGAAKWSISIGATPEGEPRGICYCDRTIVGDGTFLGQELEWPGLDAAVTKARLFVEMAP